MHAYLLPHMNRGALFVWPVQAKGCLVERFYNFEFDNGCPQFIVLFHTLQYR
jgi:hypothetical protein